MRQRRNVYILAGVPGAEAGPQRFPVVRWEDICHEKPAPLFIDYEEQREVSRWSYARRKRPFLLRDRLFQIFKSSTNLAGVIAAAVKLNKE